MKNFPTAVPRAAKFAYYAALAYAVVGINANAQNTLEKKPIRQITTGPSIVEFTGTYKALGGSLSTAGVGPGCTRPQPYLGYEPAANGKYPVFVYTVGTEEPYDNLAATTAAQRMAAKGYVAATVGYPDATFGICDKLVARSQCIFDKSSSVSAITQLCARDKADCSKGVLVAGFSQGSILAVHAHDFDSDVKAAYGMGCGPTYSIYDLKNCMVPSNYSLPSDHLWVVNGQSDGFIGPVSSQVHKFTQDTTGVSCDNETGLCQRANGSGWYIIKDSEPEDGRADHCYMRNGNCTVDPSTLDEIWLNGNEMWSLNTGLDILISLSQD